MHRQPQHHPANGKVSPYPADKFSMYSTDTEERIISLDKGLDRCATMLKLLLDQGKSEAQIVAQTGEKQPQQQILQKEKALAAGPRKGRILSERLSRQRASRNLNIQNQKGGSGSSAPSSRAQKPAAGYVSPAACSTPNGKQANRAKTEPEAKGLAVKRSSGSAVPDVGSHGSLHWTADVKEPQNPAPLGRSKGRHHRLRTEPVRVPLSNKSIHPQYTTIAAEAGRSASAYKPTTSQEQAGVTELPPTQLPAPPPPPLFHPYYHPYGFPCISPYPFPYYPQLFWSHEQPEEDISRAYPTKNQMEALDLATLHHHYLHYPPRNFYPLYHKDMLRTHNQEQQQKEQQQKEQQQQEEPPTDQQPCVEKATTPAAKDGTGQSGSTTTKPETVFKTARANLNNVTDLEGLDALLSELLGSCENGVQRILAAENSGITPHMTEELRELEGLLGHYKQHLRQQCQTLAREIREKRLSEPSVTDWLSQVQELKQEKIGLMERIKESCTAYSEVRRAMDELERQKEEIDITLKERTRQLSSLQKQLDMATKDLSHKDLTLKMTKEDLANVKNSSNSSIQELKSKNLALQQQTHSMLKELTNAQENNKKLTEQLSRVRHSLEASKEEEHMIKMTLSEKNSRIVLAEDQILGLRQCLAHFLSEATKLEDTGSRETLYCIPTRSIEKLKSLAENGNIESFLGTYSEAADKVPSPTAAREGRSSPHSTSSTITNTRQPSSYQVHSSAGSSLQLGVITPLYSNCSVTSSLLDPGSVEDRASSHNDAPPVRLPRPAVANQRTSSSQHIAAQLHLRESQENKLSTERTRTSHTAQPFIEGTAVSLSSQHTAIHRSQPFEGTAVSLSSQHTAIHMGTAAASPTSQHYTTTQPFKGAAPSLSSMDVKSSVTTKSEIDFRNNLATLDTDIARLLTQIKVAQQNK